jgi:hypothetical protein
VLALSAANLAPIQLGAGELDAADAILAEGLAHARAIAHGPLILSLLSTLALAALQRNDPAGAQEGLASASEEISPNIDAESAAIFLSATAALAATRTDPVTAATVWAATDVALHDAARVVVPAAAALRASTDGGGSVGDVGEASGRCPTHLRAQRSAAIAAHQCLLTVMVTGALVVISPALSVALAVSV